MHCTLTLPDKSHTTPREGNSLSLLNFCDFVAVHAQVYLAVSIDDCVELVAGVTGRLGTQQKLDSFRHKACSYKGSTNGITLGGFLSCLM